MRQSDRKGVGPPALLCSKRFRLALICFAGCALCYALRSNLSFAIVCMVREVEGAGQEYRKSQCGEEKNETSIQTQHGQDQISRRFRRQRQNASNGLISTSLIANDEPIPNQSLWPGEFDWSKQVRGQVLGAFFFGYLTSQMLGGLLAARVGPKAVILCSMFAASLLSLFSPFAARSHVSAFILIRALLGFTQGVMFPAMHFLWSNWAPPLERGLLTGVSYAGAQIGNVLVMPLSGLLCRHGIDGGWPSIFYSLAALGLLWCLLWAFAVADSPQRHSSIGEDERQFIMDSLGRRKDSDEISGRQAKRHGPSIPFGAILRSKAVWAILIGHFAGDWGAYTMALGLPTFLNDVLGMHLTSMGFASAIPYLVYFVVINLGGHLADSLQQHRMLSTLNCRRMAMLLALGGQAFFLLLISFCPCGYNKLVIALLTCSLGISGFQYSGFVVNYLDIAPELAGFLLGVGNTFSCMAGFLSPILMGWLTPTGSKTEWLAVFGITEIVLVAGAVLFSVLASAEVQPWAKGAEEGEEAETEGIKRKKIKRMTEEEEESRETDGNGKAEQPLLEKETNIQN